MKRWTFMMLVLMLAIAPPTLAKTLLVPPDIQYQGLLANDDGTPVRGPVDIEIGIWNALSEGTLLYSEIHSDVALVEGVFSILLGTGTRSSIKVTLLSALSGGPNRYLEITVDGETLLPRQPFSSAAYAFRAESANTATLADDADTLDGLDSIDFVQRDAPGSVTAAMLAPDSVSGTAIEAGTIQTDDLAEAAVGSDQLAPESVTAAKLVDGTGSGLDADLLDGQDSAAFMPATTDRWVNESGDTINGDLGLASGDVLLSDGSSIGFGTEDPQARISVQRVGPSDSSKLLIFAEDNSPEFYLESGFAGFGSTGNKIKLQTNFGPTNAMTWVGSGAVGIGTESPQRRLDVVGDLIAGRGTSAGDPSEHLGLRAVSDTWYLGVQNEPSQDASDFFIGLGTSEDGRFHIQNDGNVGIGTTAPNARLNVRGGSDVKPTGGGYVTLGSLTGRNLALDNNEIMARDAGAASGLALNADGGIVTVGGPLRMRDGFASLSTDDLTAAVTDGASGEEDSDLLLRGSKNLCVVGRIKARGEENQCAVTQQPNPREWVLEARCKVGLFGGACVTNCRFFCF